MSTIVSSSNSNHSGTVGILVASLMFLASIYGVLIAFFEGNERAVAFTSGLLIVQLILFLPLLYKDIIWVVNVFLLIPSTLIVSASYLHLQSNDHVWVMGEKTTITNERLVTVPLGPLAKKINLEHQIQGMLATATTKDGKKITVRISGNFRVMNNESTLLDLAELLPTRTPNEEVVRLVGEFLKKSFRRAIIQKDFSELTQSSLSASMSSSHFEIVGIAPQGEILIKDVQVYLFD